MFTNKQTNKSKALYQGGPNRGAQLIILILFTKWHFCLTCSPPAAEYALAIAYFPVLAWGILEKGGLPLALLG